MLKKLIFLLGLVLFASEFLSSSKAQYALSIDNPGPLSKTQIQAFNGTLSAGWVNDIFGSTNAFLYNGTNFTVVSGPLGASSTSVTSITGFSGNILIGTYRDTGINGTGTGNTYGFFRSQNNGNYTILYGPLGANSSGIATIDAISITGSSLVGTYCDSGQNGSGSGYTYGYLDSNLPSSTCSIIYGPLGLKSTGINPGNVVYGSTVAGTYVDSSTDGSGPNTGNTYGFSLSGSNYKIIYGPTYGNKAAGPISITGIYGTSIVGTYVDSSIDGSGPNTGNTYGFILNGSTYNIIYGPTYGNKAAGPISITGIYGTSIVGTYVDSSTDGSGPNTGNTYGFILNGTTYNIIYGPTNLNAGAGINSIIGVGGSGSSLTVLGTYLDTNGNTNGFLYDGTTYTAPLTPTNGTVGGTSLFGINGSTAFGTYQDNVGLSHGLLISPPQPQTITFPTIPVQAYGGSLTLPATSSSGLPLTYAVASGPASVSGNILTFTGMGTVRVTASQAGNAAYLPVSVTSPSIQVSIGALKLPVDLVGLSTFILTPPLSSSPGAWSYTSSDPTVATISGNQVTIVAPGSTTITATQAANGSYSRSTTTAILAPLSFVPVGNPGNANDTTGYGGVPYGYKIGTYDISQKQIDAAAAAGLQGMPTGTGVGGAPWSGNQPAASLSWNQAAAYVNWLNTSQGYAPAYNLTYSPGTGNYSMALWPTNQAWTNGGTNLYPNAKSLYFLPS